MTAAMPSDTSVPEISAADRLFAVLAEEVKLPFVHISQALELARNQPEPSSESLENLFDTVSMSTQAALRLIDGYLLHVRLQAQAQLELEPVPLSSVLYDTAAQLDAYAKAHDCRLELDIKGKYGPVMAHKPAVQAALLTLGYSFIDAAAQAADDGQAGPLVILGAGKTGQGITTGLFAEKTGLNNHLLRQARHLQGRARQPLSGFTAGSGAGVFVADALFARLDSVLRAARFKGVPGLATTLLSSRQLSLV